MKISTRNNGFTLVEMLLSIALFAQVTVLVGTVVLVAINLHQMNRVNNTVDLELYSVVTNGIGSYIRKSTGVLYADHPKAQNLQLHEKDEILNSSLASNADQRICEEKDNETFDQLSLFLNTQKTEFITFAVEKNEEAKTSRIVWKKGEDGEWHYLNSSATYISCFYISVSPDPYATNASTWIKDIQPYVHITIAGRYLYADSTVNDLNFFDQNTYTSYRGLFTLRNYIY